jgi:hypothetical protein
MNMHTDPISDMRERTHANVVALETLEDANEGLDPVLAEQLELEREVLAKLDEAIELAQNPERRRRSQPVLMLASQPTPGADELAVCVLRTALGSQLENTPITIGTLNGARVLWDPIDGLGFVSRRDFSQMRRASEIEQARLVVLDGRNGWANLYRLVTDAPARVRSIGEVALSIVRATRSPTLLRAWLEHSKQPEGTRDQQFQRVCTGQLRRVEAAAAAE